MLWFNRTGVTCFAQKQTKTGANAHYVIENGMLKLRIDERLPARPEKEDGCVSSVQTSDFRFGATVQEYQILDKFVQKYGRFEIRCRMPSGDGLRSVFKLLQHDPAAQEVTPDGKKISQGVVEINVIEQFGNKTEQQIIHCNVNMTDKGHFEHKMDFNPSKEFHVYALEWEEGKLRWYIDEKQIAEYTGETPQQKMFILLSLYQNDGEEGTGNTDPNMTYPRDFEIDYLRVYAKDK